MHYHTTFFQNAAQPFRSVSARKSSTNMIVNSETSFVCSEGYEILMAFNSSQFTLLVGKANSIVLEILGPQKPHLSCHPCIVT